MATSDILREISKWRALVWGILDPASANDGDVLTADGSGGAAFEAPAQRYAWQYHDTLDISSGTASVECATDFPTGTIGVRFFAENLSLASSANDVLIQVESDVAGYLATAEYSQQATRGVSATVDNNNSANAFRVRRTAVGDKPMGHGELRLENDDDIWSFQFYGQENPADNQGIEYSTEGFIDLAGESLINMRFNANGQTWTGGSVYVQVLAPVA